MRAVRASSAASTISNAQRTTRQLSIYSALQDVDMTRRAALRVLQAVLRPAAIKSEACSLNHLNRSFHSTQLHATDGVYEAITKMRTRTPWIEALRKSRESEKESGGAHLEPVRPDTTPKKMSDSYVKFVGLPE